METETAPPSVPPPKPAVSGRRRKWPRFLARMRQFWRRLLLLLGPIVLTAVLVAGFWMFDARIGLELLVISLVSFLGLGTTVILAPAAVGKGLDLPFLDQTFELHLGTWQIAAWLIYLNIAAAFLYAYNLDLLERVPVIGPFLYRARQNAMVALEDHKWIRRLAGVGVMIFVLLPGPGSGQLGGCFVGRVIGLPRRSVFGVVAFAGTFVAVLYAAFGNYIQRVLDDADVGPWIRVGTVLIVLVVAAVLIKLLRYLGRQPLPPDVPEEPPA